MRHWHVFARRGSSDAMPPVFTTAAPRNGFVQPIVLPYYCFEEHRIEIAPARRVESNMPISGVVIPQKVGEMGIGHVLPDRDERQS